jgi:hypothetical protein
VYAAEVIDVLLHAENQCWKDFWRFLDCFAGGVILKTYQQGVLKWLKVVDCGF